MSKKKPMKRKLFINVAPYIISYIYSTLKYKCLIVYHRKMSKKKIFGEKSLGHRSERPPPFTLTPLWLGRPPLVQEGQCCGHVSGSRTKKFTPRRWGSSRRGRTCSTNIRKLTSIIRVPGEWSGLMNWTVLLTGWADRPLVAGTGERSRLRC